MPSAMASSTRQNFDDYATGAWSTMSHHCYPTVIILTQNCRCPLVGPPRRCVHASAAQKCCFVDWVSDVWASSYFVEFLCLWEQEGSSLFIDFAVSTYFGARGWIGALWSYWVILRQRYSAIHNSQSVMSQTPASTTSVSCWTPDFHPTRNYSSQMPPPRRIYFCSICE